MLKDFGADIWQLRIFALTLHPKKDTMDKTDFKTWMDRHISEIADVMRGYIDEQDASRVYGDKGRVVMSLTFTDNDEQGIGEVADRMLMHYRCVVAEMMGKDANLKQTKGGYPLEYAMTSNTDLLGAYYNLCAKYAREMGEDCVVSVARY